MTEEQIALARRAVACRSWRLMRGMRFLLSDGGTTLITHETNPNGWVSATRGFYSRASWAALAALPDLTDPATLGCLLALVREAWGKPNGQMRFDGACGSDPRGWYYYWTANDGSVGGGLYGYSLTEAEALVAALEAAP